MPPSQGHAVSKWLSPDSKPTESACFWRGADGPTHPLEGGPHSWRPVCPGLIALSKDNPRNKDAQLGHVSVCSLIAKDRAEKQPV